MQGRGLRRESSRLFPSPSAPGAHSKALISLAWTCKKCRPTRAGDLFSGGGARGRGGTTTRVSARERKSPNPEQFRPGFVPVVTSARDYWYYLSSVRRFALPCKEARSRSRPWVRIEGNHVSREPFCPRLRTINRLLRRHLAPFFFFPRRGTREEGVRKS